MLPPETPASAPLPTTTASATVHREQDNTANNIPAFFSADRQCTASGFPPSGPCTKRLKTTQTPRPETERDNDLHLKQTVSIEDSDVIMANDDLRYSSDIQIGADTAHLDDSDERFHTPPSSMQELQHTYYASIHYPPSSKSLESADILHNEHDSTHNSVLGKSSEDANTSQTRLNEFAIRLRKQHEKARRPVLEEVGSGPGMQEKKEEREDVSSRGKIVTLGFGLQSLTHIGQTSLLELVEGGSACGCGEEDYDGNEVQEIAELESGVGDEEQRVLSEELVRQTSDTKLVGRGMFTDKNKRNARERFKKLWRRMLRRI